MNLILDIGNSFAKLAVFQADDLLDLHRVEKHSLQENAEKILAENPDIRNIMISRVANAVFELPENMKSKVSLLNLGPETLLPFKNRYGSPETLGNDRKALAAAASKHYQHRNVLVIDAGTCVTYDLKNDRNEYLGGGISPGLRMRYKAINSFTDNLPLLEPLYEGSLLGSDTASSIHSGIYLGLVKEIDGMISAYQPEYQDLIIIFTGGDAQFLSKRLKNSIFANSNFLLEGLNYILEFNTNQ